MTIAEQVLLPAVRKARPDTLVIADGFSCRDQIRHGSGRWPMHPAEVLALALESRGSLPPEIPERKYLEPPARPDPRQAALAGGVLAAAGLLLWGARRLRA
jgi:hypothetical protein